MATMVETVGAGRYQEARAALQVAEAAGAQVNVAKNVALFFAAPFIGLAYIIAFPFVGAAALVKVALRALA
jgi:hypothetical protein